MLRMLEPLAGACLIAVTLAEIFLNVLYARAGVSIFGRHIAHGVRDFFLLLGRLSRRNSPRVLSFCGPVVIVVTLLSWAGLLTLGSAMILHPALGAAVRPDNAATSTDFVTALYAAGGLISSVGPGSLTPHTAAYRLVFLFDSFLGIGVLTLSVTYLMQLYAALQQRDELALKIELMTGQTGDAARLLAGLGPEGRFELGYASLAEMAAELSRVKEAHHLYPVLFYFRFPEAHYELSRFTLVLLDAVALIRTALDEPAAGWLMRSAAVEHLERGGLVLIDTLHRVYLRDETAGPERPSEVEDAAWRRRFLRAGAVLRAAGVPVRRDLVRCADAYVQLRNRWNEPLMRLGAAIGHQPWEIDPALHHPDPPRQSREARAGALH